MAEAIQSNNPGDLLVPTGEIQQIDTNAIESGQPRGSGDASHTNEAAALAGSSNGLEAKINGENRQKDAASAELEEGHAVEARIF